MISLHINEYCIYRANVIRYQLLMKMFISFHFYDWTKRGIITKCQPGILLAIRKCTKKKLYFIFFWIKIRIFLVSNSLYLNLGNSYNFTTCHILGSLFLDISTHFSLSFVYFEPRKYDFHRRVWKLKKKMQWSSFKFANLFFILDHKAWYLGLIYTPAQHRIFCFRIYYGDVTIA